MKTYENVIEAKPLENYKIQVVFNNGETGVFDCSYLLNDKFWEPLRNETFFRLAHAECGTIVWNDDIDIAPESVWERTVRSGFAYPAAAPETPFVAESSSNQTKPEFGHE